ncbi:MAG: hypothetical protein QW717_08150 [Candidatus Bathyarchaeia archaeon]
MKKIFFTVLSAALLLQIALVGQVYAVNQLVLENYIFIRYVEGAEPKLLSTEKGCCACEK